jgi:hypothetical protein
MVRMNGCCEEYGQVKTCANGVDTYECPVCHSKWTEPCGMADVPAARDIKAVQVERDPRDMGPSTDGHLFIDGDGTRTHCWSFGDAFTNGEEFRIVTKGERHDYVGDVVLTCTRGSVRDVEVRGEVA